MKTTKIYKFIHALQNTYTALQTDSGIYWRSEYFKDKYRVKSHDLRKAIENGLPYIRKSNQYYFLEEDFNAYYAGKIGNDVDQI